MGDVFSSAFARFSAFTSALGFLSFSSGTVFFASAFSAGFALSVSVCCGIVVGVLASDDEAGAAGAEEEEGAELGGRAEVISGHVTRKLKEMDG